MEAVTRTTRSHTSPRGTTPSSVSRATAYGVAWLLVQSVSTRITGFVSQIILAWLLLPGDFGLIGLANTLAIVVNALVAFGLDEVLQQRQRNMTFLNSAAVWFSAILGLLGMTLLLVAAPIGQAVYHEPRLILMIVPLAIALPIGALSTVPTVLLRSRLAFRWLAGIGAAELMLTQALTIILAALGFNAFSFVLPIPIVALGRTVLMWWKAPVKVVRRVRPKQIRYLANNGAVVFVSKIIVEIIGQGDYITLGLMASSSVVGLYYFAFRLSAQPVRMLAGSFTGVIFPALIRLGGDHRRQIDAAVNAAVVLFYLVIPLSFLQTVIADPLIHLLFADKWTGSIPMVQALSIGLPFDAVAWIAGLMLTVRGEFRRNLFYTLLTMPTFFLFAALGAWLGMGFGVAIAVSLFYILTSSLYTWVIFLRYGALFRQIRHIYVVPLVVGTIAFGTAYGLSLFGGMEQSPLFRIAIIATTGPVIYATGIYLLDRAAFIDILNRIGLGSSFRRFVAT